MKIDPYNFITQFNIEDSIVSYYNLVEICQGGPLVGFLLLNNQPLLENIYFGGPSLLFENKIIIPQLLKHFFSKKFIITIIDIKTKKSKVFGKKKDLILLSRIQENKIFYYTDLENKNLESINYIEL
ncbi:MAG: hypothetical protein HXX09_14275 [Bacteroidetes bacterium]|nr:hypothetical protein [Bacteroidota bacterium]